ncbi:hypothetical protein GCM10028825_04230 [Spirosoma agri]
MDRHEFFRLAATSVGVMLLAPAHAGCAKSDAGDPATDAGQTLDFLVNLNANDNENLSTKGGYVIVNNVLVAQTNDGLFVAVSSKCTYQGGTALVFKPKENQFYCPLDLSRFDIKGRVVSGPATVGLKQYVVTDMANGTLRVQA